MQSWIEKNKNVLKFFGIYSGFTFLFSAYFVSVVTSNISELQTYAQNKLLTETLTKIALIGIFDFIVIAVWIVTLLLIFFKMIFPKKNSFKKAFFIDEFTFLKNLPKNIKGEIDNE